MNVKMVFEKENEDGTYTTINLNTAKSLLASGKYWTESKTIGVEFLQANETFCYTLMINHDEEE